MRNFILVPLCTASMLFHFVCAFAVLLDCGMKPWWACASVTVTFLIQTISLLEFGENNGAKQSNG